MHLPLGLKSPKPRIVCRLRKSLYMMKQALCCWFAKRVIALKYMDSSNRTMTTLNLLNVVILFVSKSLYTWKQYN